MTSSQLIVAESGDRSTLRTDDIFLGAFGLIRGGELERIETKSTTGRRFAVFVIRGAQEAEREFHRGPALVDLRLLKSEVRRLKDAAFDAIRQEEKKRDARDEGRNRSHQVRQSA